ncbi:MAG: (d)CMP kinase, partial [Steroidobacteraceae bacterium]
MPQSPFTPPGAAFIVTIDGPSGSGKGTISRAVAKHAGWHLLDSGALYRLVALAGLRAGVASDDQEGYARLAAAMDVVFGIDTHGGEFVTLGGRDVT